MALKGFYFGFSVISLGIKMNKEIWSLLAVAVVVGSLVGVPLYWSGEEGGTLKVSIENLTTGEDNYSSYEQLDLNMSVKSSEELDNLQIHVWGIQNRGGDNWVDDVRYENIGSGEKDFTMHFRMPRCNACAGFSEGAYYINGELLLNGSVLDAENTSIYLS